MVVITIPPCPVAAPARTWTRGARATRSFLLLLERGKRKRKERKDERYPTNHHLPLKCTAAQCRSVVSSAAVHLAAHASWKQMHSFYTSLLLRLEGALKRVGLGGKEKEERERENKQSSDSGGACLSLGIRFEGNVHVMEHPWRVATFILDGAVCQSARRSKCACRVVPPRHPIRSQTDHNTGVHQD